MTVSTQKNYDVAEQHKITEQDVKISINLQHK